MSAFDYDTLKKHIGHKIVCVSYGCPGEEPDNVAIECEDCGKVLFDYDRPEEDNSESECQIGNTDNDCTDCIYGKHYHFASGKCVTRGHEL